MRIFWILLKIAKNSLNLNTDTYKKEVYKYFLISSHIREKNPVCQHNGKHMI